MAKFFKIFCQNTRLKKKISKKIKKKDGAKRMVQRFRKHLDVCTGMVTLYMLTKIGHFKTTYVHLPHLVNVVFERLLQVLLHFNDLNPPPPITLDLAIISLLED